MRLGISCLYIFTITYARVVVEKDMSVCLGKFQLYRQHLTLHRFKLI